MLTAIAEEPSRPRRVEATAEISVSPAGHGRTFSQRLFQKLRSPKRLVIGTVALLGIVAATGAVVRDSSPEELRLWTVEPTAFRETIDTEGTVEPLRIHRVASECRWSVRILSVVPEGTWVQKGDVVCVLDGSEIEEFLRTREVSLIRARAGLETSVQEELLEEARGERLRSKAEYALQNAELELREYAEGQWPEDLDTIERDLQVAEDRLRTLEDDHNFTRQLWVQGQTNRRSLEQASLELHRQLNRVDRISGDRDLMTQFAHPRTMIRLNSRRDDAERSLLRTELSTSLAETRARIDTLSQERRVSIYERYVDSARKSLEACTLRAPRDGQVIHANSWYWKSRGVTSIEPGRSVTYQQPVFEIPDSHRFKVSVPLDESLITRVYRGMTAGVRLKGFEQDVIAAEITHISRYPRPRSYYTPGIRDYWLDLELKPTAEQQDMIRNKMDAAVSLTLKEIPEALMIPRAAVVGSAGRYFVWRMQDEDLVVQPVELGDVQGDQVVVLDGLSSGDQVATELSEQQYDALEQHLNTQIAGL